jgi:hypothetical protein
VINWSLMYANGISFIGIYQISKNMSGMLRWEFAIALAFNVPHHLRLFVYYFCYRGMERDLETLSRQFVTHLTALEFGELRKCASDWH